MILVGSQRSSARALADHLTNTRDNDHVALLDVEGFMANDLHGAMDEAHAIAGATRCQKFLFSVSLNPPQGVVVTDDGFRATTDRVAAVLGLSDQPHAMVVHEKNGRRHAHAVWSRIDGNRMQAIELGLYKAKLRDLSRDLFLDHGWEVPQGLQTYGQKNPLNFTLAEWQQSLRSDVDPREMKQLLRSVWERSDDLKSTAQALEEHGLFLAKGDRRGFVALDLDGNVYSLSRWMGVKSKELSQRLGPVDALPSMHERAKQLRGQVFAQLRGYIRQVKVKHAEDRQPLREKREALVAIHRAERLKLAERQEKRWAEETKARFNRLNKGIRGVFDRLTGAHQRTRKRNEAEAVMAAKRDQQQRDGLVIAQMEESTELQVAIKELAEQQAEDRLRMARIVREIVERLRRYGETQRPGQDRRQAPSLDR